MPRYSSAPSTRQSRSSSSPYTLRSNTSSPSSPSMLSTDAETLRQLRAEVIRARQEAARRKEEATEAKSALRKAREAKQKAEEEKKVAMSNADAAHSAKKRFLDARDRAISCPVCHEISRRPFTWFQNTIAGRMEYTRAPEHLRHPPYTAAQLDEIYRSRYALIVSYSCPMCRKDVQEKPIETRCLKELIDAISDAFGVPTEVADDLKLNIQDPWADSWFSRQLLATAVQGFNSKSMYWKEGGSSDCGTFGYGGAGHTSNVQQTHRIGIPPKVAGQKVEAGYASMGSEFRGSYEDRAQAGKHWLQIKRVLKPPQWPIDGWDPHDPPSSAKVPNRGVACQQRDGVRLECPVAGVVVHRRLEIPGNGSGLLSPALHPLMVLIAHICASFPVFATRKSIVPSSRTPPRPMTISVIQLLGRMGDLRTGHWPRRRRFRKDGFPLVGWQGNSGLHKHPYFCPFHRNGDEEALSIRSAARGCAPGSSLIGGDIWCCLEMECEKWLRRVPWASGSSVYGSYAGSGHGLWSWSVVGDGRGGGRGRGCGWGRVEAQALDPTSRRGLLAKHTPHAFALHPQAREESDYV
ncbi:hypothetical protein BV22DRAFT_1050654 [Leucogyrophana mollusca]|uniref:Uncharacterized protein n=1 Tax=Leucogyrophana mollusca TaxID=85980 RepID=A0ACB8B3K9_9AGAM|nr:hypothetical protein BV22DRAFT_1050654 [Leucogyrophana mollusca]